MNFVICIVIVQEWIINLVIYIHIWTLLYVYYLDEEDEPMKTIQAPAEESDDDEEDDDDSGKNLFVLAWFWLSFFLPTWPKELFHCQTLNPSSQSSIDLDVPRMILYNFEYFLINYRPMDWAAKKTKRCLTPLSKIF